MKKHLKIITKKLNSKALQGFTSQKIKKVRKKIKSRFIIFLMTIFSILTLAYLFYPQIKDLVTTTIQLYGFIAVFFIAYLSDILMQPIAPDLPIILGISFNLNPFLLVSTVIISSFLATTTGYYFGVWFGVDGFKKFYGEKKYKKVRKNYLKYRFIIPIAAISPVPYVPICWISGMFRMNKLRFFLYAMVPRSLRFILVALISNMIIH